MISGCGAYKKNILRFCKENILFDDDSDNGYDDEYDAGVNFKEDIINQKITF